MRYRADGAFGMVATVIMVVKRHDNSGEKKKTGKKE